MGLKGVNLGNWLVLEKWMDPSLFEGTDAEDETELVHKLSKPECESLYQRHRSTFITEEDFKALKQMGVDAVRIPVPHFIFGDYPPFLGCIDVLDRAFEWALAYGLVILIDLHTIPGGQNGFDNSGLSGVCLWHTQPESQAFALSVLKRLALRYRDHAALYGIEILNEPVSSLIWKVLNVPKTYPAVDATLGEKSYPAPVAFVEDFYNHAYRLLRQVLKPESVIVFHDNFRPWGWKKFFKRHAYENVVLDMHLYLNYAEKVLPIKRPKTYKKIAHWVVGPLLKATQCYVPVVVGEWCLSHCGAALKTYPEPERLQAYRDFYHLQMSMYASCQATFFWSYKLQVERLSWNYQALDEAGCLDPE